MSKAADRGTDAVLLLDLIATLGAVVFAIAYSKYNPWAFAPILLVTLFLSLLIAGLVHQSNRTHGDARSVESDAWSNASHGETRVRRSDQTALVTGKIAPRIL